MKYPCLVPKTICTTPIHVTIYDEGVSEDGAPIEVYNGDLTCNYQDSAKTIFTKEQKQVAITGSALFCGDIVPSLATISGGVVTVFGVKRRIAKGVKARNPDGTVNYVRLDLE